MKGKRPSKNGKAKNNSTTAFGSTFIAVASAEAIDYRNGNKNSLIFSIFF